MAIFKKTIKLPRLPDANRATLIVDEVAAHEAMLSGASKMTAKSKKVEKLRDRIAAKRAQKYGRK